MKKIGYGITRKDSIVLWWGGLRGVIGLAMALIVAGETSIDHEVRDQFSIYYRWYCIINLI